MTFEDIKLLIDEFPKYIQYLYPGYITIYLYYYFRGLTLKDDKNVLLKSMALSFVYVLIIDKLSKAEYATLGYNLGLIILSIAIAYVAYRLIESASFNESLKGIDIYISPHWNEIDALRDSENGNKAWLKVFLKEGNIAYEGSLMKHESENEKKCFIMLSGYRKLYIETDGSERVLSDFKFNNKEKVILYAEDIKYIESAGIARIQQVDIRDEHE